MSSIPFHRVTFLPTRLALPAGQEHFAGPTALLLYTTLFEHFLRHPRVAVTDPDDFRIEDGEGRLLDAAHPAIENVKAYELYENRRDEILWFEISLDGARPAPIKLVAERYGEMPSELVAPPGGTLSDALASCIGQWLAARGLPPAPRPLETFDYGDLYAVVQHGYQILLTNARDPQAARQMLSVPPKLAVPFCRFMGISLGIGVESTILQIEPDNPWALRDDHLVRWHDKGASRDEVRRVISLAPAWGKPYGLLFGEGVSDEESFRGYAMNATLLPANVFALDGYAYALYKAGRWEEACRLASRAAELFPRFLPAHIHAMDAMSDIGRYGQAYLDAQRRIARLDEMVEQQRVFSGAEPDVCFVRLRHANVMQSIGRLDEAIALRRRALDSVGNPNDWPKMREVLAKWERDPTVLAFAFAKEGYYRGDPGRAVYGSARGVFDYFDQLQVFVESLIQVGKAELAPLAHAHYRHVKAGKNVYAHLAGARAQLANKRLAPALDALVSSALRSPQAPIEGEIERLLRVAAALPAEEWERVVAGKLELGARRVARQIARDGADFHPELGRSDVIARALSGQTGIEFDPSALLTLREALGGAQDLAAIDALLDRFLEPTLEHADGLVNGWPAACPRPGAEDPAAKQRYQAQLLYLLTETVCRYLALTTQPADVLAGGYRQVATQVLAAIRDAKAVYDGMVLRAFFEAIERHAAVDPWLFDGFMLRIERALEIDRRLGGHVEGLVTGLPYVAASLRGDEDVGAELRSAGDLANDPARAAEALRSYERSVRAVGGNPAPAWSDLASTTLPPEEALDVHWTAVHAHPLHAGPAVNAARLLFASGRSFQGFEVLVQRLGWAGKAFRERAAESLRASWEQSVFPVPFDWQAAQARGYEAIQAGQYDEALACYRWCDALDPGNDVCLRNLGIAYCRLGRIEDALAVLAEVDLAEAPVMVARELHAAGHPNLSILAFRYAALGGRPDALLQLASVAYEAQDDEACAEGYDGAFRVVALDGPQLNAYAGLLDNLGRFDECEAVARKLLEVAGQDTSLQAAAYHHYACSLLGRGRGAEGVDPARQALQLNREPANQAIFEETLSRCESGDPRPLAPTMASTPEGEAFLALARGDVARVIELGNASTSWKVRRAALSASELRGESASRVHVSERALGIAEYLLEESSGQVDPDAALARAHALRIRENALYPIDPPPLLGRRLTYEELDRQLAERRGVVPGAAGQGDPEILPGTKLPRLSDYVALMKAMRGGDVMGTLGRFGLDPGTYGQLAAQWAEKLQADPALMQRFTQAMAT